MKHIVAAIVTLVTVALIVGLQLKNGPLACDSVATAIVAGVFCYGMVLSRFDPDGSDNS